MSSRTVHVTTETVFGQTLALWVGNGDEHCALESDMTGLNVKGNLYLYPGRSKNNQVNWGNLDKFSVTMENFNQCSTYVHAIYAPPRVQKKI